jgi:hypothetical protein
MHSNPILFKSRKCLEIKLNANVRVVSRPKFHVLSNGALVFAVSQILCTGKLIKIFPETVFAFHLHFQHMLSIPFNLQENQVHHSKDRKILV